MKQIVFFGTKKKELCNNVKRKSNCEELLSVNVSTKNEKSFCGESSSKMNFRLFNYFAKIKIKKIVKCMLNTYFVG